MHPLTPHPGQPNRPVCVGDGRQRACYDPKTGKQTDQRVRTFVLPPDLDEKIERERARWEAERARAEAEEHDLYVRGRARWRAERAREEAERARAAEAERARVAALEAEAAAAAEAERARVEAGRAARQVAGKCVNTLIPLIKPSLSPTNSPLPPDVPMNPPPGEPNDDSDKSNSSAGKGGLVGTALTAGKNAVLFVITHPVTPYAVGAAVGVGVCYYCYKWFTSGNSESDGKEEEATEEIEKPKT